jgi:hypothetical protein
VGVGTRGLNGDDFDEEDRDDEGNFAIYQGFGIASKSPSNDSTNAV